MYQNRDQSDMVIIQGDSYQKNVYIDGVFLSAIEGVYFSCGKLNLSKKLDFDDANNNWFLLLTPEETEILKPVVTDYDITVKFNGNKVQTGLYRGKLIVSEKNNPVHPEVF